MDIRQRVKLLENIIQSLGAFKECFLETHNFIAKTDSVIFTLENIKSCEKNLLDLLENGSKKPDKELEKDQPHRSLEIQDGLVTRLL